MKYILPLLACLMGFTPSVEAISQYEVEDKPNQYQLAYTSNNESIYIDLSTLHQKQDTVNFKTVQTRMISIYKDNQVIADYIAEFTFYKQTMGGTAPTMAWQISKPTFFAINGFPIDTAPQQRLTKDYGQHMVKKGSSYQKLGDYIYSTCNELQKITYTDDNPYIPPKVFSPVVNTGKKDALFAILPPRNPERTPMDDVIPVGPPPRTAEPPVLQPDRIGPGMPPPPFHEAPPMPFHITMPPYGPPPNEINMDESSRYEPPRIDMNQLGMSRPPQRGTHAGPPGRR